MTGVTVVRRAARVRDIAVTAAVTALTALVVAAVVGPTSGHLVDSLASPPAFVDQADGHVAAAGAPVPVRGPRRAETAKAAGLADPLGVVRPELLAVTAGEGPALRSGLAAVRPAGSGPAPGVVSAAVAGAVAVPAAAVASPAPVGAPLRGSSLEPAKPRKSKPAPTSAELSAAGASVRTATGKEAKAAGRAPEDGSDNETKDRGKERGDQAAGPDGKGKEPHK